MNPLPSSKPALETTTRNSVENDLERHLDPPFDDSEFPRQELSGAVATHLVKHLAPRTALDVGCARGFLVDALVREGVDAHGIDISEDAISEAITEVRDRLSVRDITEPLDGCWDLVICVGVLEHINGVEAQRALDYMTAVTDLVLFSSTPRQYDDPAHVNVHAPADWAEWFALRGFFRRTDVDVSGISHWATVYERRHMSAPSVVHLYEAELAPLREEVLEKRAALLAMQVQLDGLRSDHADAQEWLVDTSVERVLSLTDQVLGLQAELGQLRYTYERFTREAEARIEEERDRRRFRTPQVDDSPAILRSRLLTEGELRQALARQLLEETARADEAQRQLEAIRAAQSALAEAVDPAPRSGRALPSLRRMAVHALRRVR